VHVQLCPVRVTMVCAPQQQYVNLAKLAKSNQGTPRAHEAHLKRVQLAEAFLRSLESRAGRQPRRPGSGSESPSEGHLKSSSVGSPSMSSPPTRVVAKRRRPDADRPAKVMRPTRTESLVAIELADASTTAINNYARGSSHETEDSMRSSPSASPDDYAFRLPARNDSFSFTQAHLFPFSASVPQRTAFAPPAASGFHVDSSDAVLPTGQTPTALIPLIPAYEYATGVTSQPRPPSSSVPHPVASLGFDGASRFVHPSGRVASPTGQLLEVFSLPAESVDGPSNFTTRMLRASPPLPSTSATLRPALASTGNLVEVASSQGIASASKREHGHLSPSPSQGDGGARLIGLGTTMSNGQSPPSDDGDGEHLPVEPVHFVSSGNAGMSTAEASAMASDMMTDMLPDS
jgi:hypothetical protein